MAFHGLGGPFYNPNQFGLVPGSGFASNLLVFVTKNNNGDGSAKEAKLTGNEFLDGLLAKTPLLRFALKASVVALFLEADQPFANDREYMRALEHLLLLQNNFYQGNRLLEQVHMDPKLTEEWGDQLVALMSRVVEVKDKLREICKKRVELGGDEKAPRFVRMLRKYDITEKEADALSYHMLQQVSETFNIPSSDARTVRLFFGFTPEEITKLYNAKRKHIKDGLLEVQVPGSLLTTTVTVPQEAVLAVMGCKLTEAQFLKIDKTALAEVLMEEPGSKYNIAKTDTDRSPLSSVPGFEINEAGDLYEFLRLQKEQELKTIPGLGFAAAAAGPLGEEPEEKEKVPGEPAAPAAADGEGEDEAATGKKKAEGEEDDEDSDKISSYKTDLDYLEDQFKLMGTILALQQSRQNVRRMKIGHLGQPGFVNPAQEKHIRELKNKKRVLSARCAKRLQLTIETAAWIPRLERLATARKLDGFERSILITVIGSVISEEIQMSQFGGVGGTFTVNMLLNAFCQTLEDKIKFRRYFYKSATLVKEGILKINNIGVGGDLTAASVQVDRRMLDFVVGLETEFNELVEGSHLYFPKVKMEQVVLPDDQKELILNTVTSFDVFKSCRKRLGFEEVISYGAGVTVLFHGASGTGKTMMANAIAHHLSKRILLINFPSLGGNQAGEVMKYIFREAKINDAIVFFDECEALFETRDKGNPTVNLLLSELERHDGLTVMATNRPFDLDEAMHRRITLAIEFKQPDPLMRQKIWAAHLPETLKLGPDVDLKVLAMKYELTGGFIKNAILSALSRAVSRDAENISVSHEDLDSGARLQLRGRLRMVDFYRRIVPTHGLDGLVVERDLRQQLEDIVNYEKARSVMFTQWGFDEKLGRDQGVTALFYGPPGTGKSLSAEAIGYEVGKPLKVVNCAELVSKYVGETGKNIEAVFEEARTADAVLVFDEAEGLFGNRTAASTSVDRYANIDVGLLLYHMERFSGIVLLTTNQKELIDPAFFRRLKFVLEFPHPDRELRKNLWRSIIPSKTPLAKDVDFDLLAGRFEFAGGNIKSAVFKAASRAALRPEADRRVKMEDLLKAAEEEKEKAPHLMRGIQSESARLSYV